MRIDDLDTPCLLLDIDAVDRNIAAMAAFLADKPAKLRPHFKTPKTPEIARRQLAAGAIGITVAKPIVREVAKNVVSKAIVSCPGVDSESRIACRSEPAPLLFVLVTMNV